MKKAPRRMNRISKSVLHNLKAPAGVYYYTVMNHATGEAGYQPVQIEDMQTPELVKNLDYMFHGLFLGGIEGTESMHPSDILGEPKVRELLREFIDRGGSMVFGHLEKRDERPRPCFIVTKAKTEDMMPLEEIKAYREEVKARFSKFIQDHAKTH